MRASAREKPILDGDRYVEGGTMVRACSRKVARKAVALATRATLVIGAVSLAYPAPAVWSADHGVVEVIESPEHPWGLGACGAVVMEQCIEP